MARRTQPKRLSCNQNAISLFRYLLEKHKKVCARLYCKILLCRSIERMKIMHRIKALAKPLRHLDFLPSLPLSSKNP